MGAPEEECFSSAGSQLASTHLPEEYLHPPSLILLFPTYLTEKKWILTEVAGLYSHLEKKRGTSPGKGGFKFICKKGHLKGHIEVEGYQL
ncbi:Dedicator Of Cytokinesis Protein 3 [Manis pentadactyla]|nr:Dedicator Of Cytokinesis Protein 3 [Manis pentadactyla]